MTEHHPQLLSTMIPHPAILLALSLWGIPWCSLAAAQERSEPARIDTAPRSALAFAGVTVVDVRTGEQSANQTIVVEGTRIRTVGATGSVPIPAGARVIKASGAYVIPGLWDMHVHPFQLEALAYPLFIANGVTGVRDMGSAVLDSIVQWRREITMGTRVGPRVLTAGPSIHGPGVSWYQDEQAKAPGQRLMAHAAYARTPDEGRRLVDSLKRAGVDFLKVREGVSRATWFAIASQARHVGLPLTGHQPSDVTLREAADSGQRSFEHEVQCTTASLETSVERPQEFDERECKALATHFRRTESWLSLGLPYVQCFVLSRCADQVRYWPTRLLTGDTTKFWADVHRELSQGFASRRSLEAFSTRPYLGEVEVARWHRAGMRFLAGTDVGPPFAHSIVPGFSLQDQLWYLVQIGMTPLEALQTATLNPAEFLHATDSLGTVEAGKLADLVFLDANPLADIYNTRRIRAVVANGRFFDRGDLDLVLAETERRATTEPWQWTR